MREEEDVDVHKTRPTQQPFFDLVSNMWEAFSESLIRDSDVNLLCDIEISIEVKVKLSLLRKMEIQIAGDGEDSDNIENNEKSNLVLQSKGSLLDPSTDKGSDPLEGKG
jgi:hypothetical protein